MTVSPGSYVDSARPAVAGRTEDLIDVRSIVATLRRRLRLIAVITAVVFGLACLALANAQPVYTATSQVVLDRAQEQVVSVQAVTTELPPDSPAVDTEVQILRSPQLAGRVVDALNLTEHPSFAPGTSKPSWFDRLRASVTGASEQPVAAVSPEKARATAMGRVLGNLEIKREGLTYAINITYSSSSPQTAALVANAVAEQYLASQLTAKYGATQAASGWLSSRLTGLRAQVEAAEAAVQQYRAANGLIAASGDDTIAQQELSNLNGLLAEARAVQAERDAQLATARAQLAAGSTGEDVGEALGSPVVSQLRAQRADVSRQLADLRGRYGPRHPDLAKLQRELADADTQIASEIGRQISNLEAQAEVARQRTQSLTASLNRTRGTLSANDAASVRLAELERNAEAARAIYQSFLDRYRQTTAQQGVEQPTARIIARASPPGAPVSPEAGLFLAGGLGGGLILGFGAAFLLQALESGFATAESVESRLNVPCVGAVPDLPTSLKRGERSGRIAPSQFIIERPLSAFAEAFRVLRSSIVYSRPDRTIRIVGVTSALPGEGKTTTAVGLVRTAALSGASAVLIDCDARRRAVAGVLGVSQGPGLVEVLAGSAPLESALRLDEASGAFWLPVTGAPEALAGWLESSAMNDLLQALASRFSLVVLDMPPVLPVAESRILATKADAVVLLVRWRRTPQQAAESAIRALDAVGARIVGAALTMVDAREQPPSGVGRGRPEYGDYFQ